jgi:hypothetical protein
MSLAVLELLLDEHAVKEPDGRRHGPVLTVVLLELGTTHHAKGLDRSGRGATPTRPLHSRAADDRVPRETVSTPRAARATVFAACRGSPSLEKRWLKIHQDAEATTNFEENLAF